MKTLTNYTLDTKHHVVFGFGVEGKSVLDFLLHNNVTVDVFEEDEGLLTSDDARFYQEKGVRFFSHLCEEIFECEVAVRSPGISLRHRVLAKLEKKGAIVTSSTQIFFDLCPCEIIGVSGTKGKGTTSTLIYEMLSLCGKDVCLGGNIGTPLLSFLDKLSSESIVVIELSSFQLIDIKSSPHIAVLLMIVPEHLDYHIDFEEYITAKRNLVRFQKVGDIAVFNHDFPVSNESDVFTLGKPYYVSRSGEVLEGCYVDEGNVVLKIDGRKETVIDVSSVSLIGDHNLENVCAASLASYLAGVPVSDIATVLGRFGGLEHRLEFVSEHKGVFYYNDSFSTIPETTIAAIESFSDPLVLILGGSSKESDFSELGKVVSGSNIRAVIGIGEEWKTIQKYIDLEDIEVIDDCKSMKEIVDNASSVAREGDVVLLSPACASFDMFEDYKDRGNQFKKEVVGLQ